MDAPMCPDCGTRRDVEYRKDPDGKPVLACIACGIERACCPFCRTFKVGYSPSGTMRCALCLREFIPPETRDFDWAKLTGDQIDWLIEISNRFRLAKLESFDSWVERTERNAVDYIRTHLKRFLVIPRLLENPSRSWTEEEIEQKILAENMYVASERHFRLRKVKELLACLQTSSGVLFPERDQQSG